MGTDAGGAFTAIANQARTATSTFDDFIEPAADVAHALYATPALLTGHDAVRLDTGTPMFMRAPGEAPGSIALESAVDEMAEACGMDPLAFRLKNYAEVEPSSGRPFSSKALRECYAQGAERFGWSRRPLAPRRMRDEAGLLVGWGMGTAIFPALMFAGHARAVLKADGTGVVETGAHDMGQGAWTALAQIAADGLGLPLDRIDSGPATPPCRTRASPAAPPTRRRRASPSTGPAPTRSRSWRAWRRGTGARRCSEPATRAWLRVTAGCTAATTRRGARATPTSWRAPGWARSRGAAPAPQTRRPRPPSPCTRTGRCSRR
jgi:hypothetical protein